MPMDGDVAVSLWCEEVEDEQSREQGRTQGGDVLRVSPPALLRAAWDPTVSGRRVVQRLLHVEERYTPSTLYVALVQREPARREELAKWALEVCCECGCDEAVFPLSVSLMDRFLSASLSLPVSPYCLVAGCVLIASKLAECDNVSADTLCAAAEYDFTPSTLREMERVVLATLRWDTAAVTPQDFLPHFLSFVEQQRGGRGGDSSEEDEEDEDEDDEELVSTLRRHCDTLAAMCVCDSRFLGAPPSLVAAASLNCALRGLSSSSRGHRGPAQLALLRDQLAELCHTDPLVLQAYSDMIECGLRQRLNGGVQQRHADKDEDVEDERAGTPTDMRDIDF